MHWRSGIHALRSVHADQPCPAYAFQNHGVTVDYSTAYDSASGTYLVNTVTVDGISDSCKGESIEVSLKDTDGRNTTSTTRTAVTGTKQSIPVDGFAGESVDSAAVFIGSRSTRPPNP